MTRIGALIGKTDCAKSQNVFLAGVPSSVVNDRLAEMVHVPHHIDFRGLRLVRFNNRLTISLVACFCILMRSLGRHLWMTLCDLVIVKVTGRGHDLDCLKV